MNTYNYMFDFEKSSQNNSSLVGINCIILYLSISNLLTVSFVCWLPHGFRVDDVHQQLRGRHPKAFDQVLGPLADQWKVLDPAAGTKKTVEVEEINSFKTVLQTQPYITRNIPKLTKNLEVCYGLLNVGPLVDPTDSQHCLETELSSGKSSTVLSDGGEPTPSQPCLFHAFASETWDNSFSRTQQWRKG